MSKYVAEPNFVEKVFLALEIVDPNDPATMDWDDEAIQELGNYLRAKGYVEGMLDALDDLYPMYDLLKWTRANNA